jgi:hypothetical protein
MNWWSRLCLEHILHLFLLEIYPGTIRLGEYIYRDKRLSLNWRIDPSDLCVKAPIFLKTDSLTF